MWSSGVPTGTSRSGAVSVSAEIADTVWSASVMGIGRYEGALSADAAQFSGRDKIPDGAADRDP